MSVLVLGSSGPETEIVLRRLAASGRRLAVHGGTSMPGSVSSPGDGATPGGATPAGPGTRPDRVIRLTGDRTDVEDVAQLVADAERALGGLDAVVVLPGEEPVDAAALRTSTDAWADLWARTLASEVLASVCAAHAAARSFLRRGRQGVVVLVTDHRGGGAVGPAAAAALDAAGRELAAEWEPHGIAVSVVAASPAACATPGGDLGADRLAAVVDALLSIPGTAGGSLRLG